MVDKYEQFRMNQKILEVQDSEYWLQEHGYKRVLLPFDGKSFKWYMQHPDGTKVWHIYGIKGFETILIENAKGFTLKMDPKNTSLKVTLNPKTSRLKVT